MKKCLNCGSEIINRFSNVIYCTDKCSKQFRYNSKNNSIRQKLIKDKQYLKDNSSNCFYCNKLLEDNDKTIEHIIPDLHLNDLNIVIVCQNCNKSKKNKNLLLWAKEKNLLLSNECLSLYSKLEGIC